MIERASLSQHQIREQDAYWLRIFFPFDISIRYGAAYGVQSTTFDYLGILASTGSVYWLEITAGKKPCALVWIDRLSLYPSHGQVIKRKRCQSLLLWEPGKIILFLSMLQKLLSDGESVFRKTFSHTLQ